MVQKNRSVQIFSRVSLLILMSLSFSLQAQKTKKTTPVVIGYVGGFRGIVDTSIIDVSLLTHINYAFVDVKDNRAWLHNEATDSVNFRKLNIMRYKNPSLKILISIGGWAWSENFSDAVLTDTARKAFAQSSVDIIKTYQLDGVDIDWEYPGVPGEAGNIYRPEDKENYTLMFKEIRLELDSLEQLTGKKYLLTTAVGGGQYFIDHTEMDKAAQYLNYINLMTYDFSSNRSGHHTNLFDSKDKTITSSAHKTVNSYIAAGVPAGKLVMGIAFYGKGGIVNDSTGKWFNQPFVSSMRGGGYSFIKDSLVNQRGYKDYWDKKAKAPYLYAASNKAFITYENERSVKQKCKYVLKNKMAGVMFWEYSSDPKGYLLTTINETLY